jgi:hypothetical protein
MINVTKEPSHSHKIKTQRENLGRNCWEIQGEDSRHG